MAEYAAQESGQQDLSFTFLYKCAQRLGVDVIELLTGEDPHLSGYSLTRAAEGLSIKRRAGFEYLHKAPHFKNKLAEPFLVTAPYLEEEQDAPIHLSYHKGQELDYIISGRMRLRLRGSYRRARGGRPAHVRFQPRPRHDRHRRRAVHVPRGGHEAARGDYLGAAPRADGEKPNKPPAYAPRIR